MFLEISGHLLHAVSFGSGPRTLLAHGGWIGNWELWLAPFEQLSRNWRVVAYDHRGCGESLVAPEEITDDALVQDLFLVLDRLDIRRCILAGESAGVRIALQAALRDQQRFEGLVLVDGSAGAQKVSEPSRQFAEWLRVDFEAACWDFIRRCILDHEGEHVQRWGYDILKRAKPEQAVALWQSGWGIDLAERLGEIQLPTLVIRGSGDKIVPLARGEELAALIPESKLVVIENAGHVPTMTRPQEVVEAIRAFFLRM